MGMGGMGMYPGMMGGMGMGGMGMSGMGMGGMGMGYPYGMMASNPYMYSGMVSHSFFVGSDQHFAI